MPRLSLPLLIVPCLPTSALAKRPPRFHLATPALQTRLARNPRVGRNLDAVAEYRRASGKTGGTAFLVSAPDKDGMALMLTNHHVALYDKKTVAGDTLLFQRNGVRSRTPARVVGCLAADAELDFALLRVQLPKKLRDLEPVRLTLRGSRGVRAVYNAGFPRIWKAERERAAEQKPSLVATNKQNRPAFARALKSHKRMPKMVQVGQIDDGLWVEPFITLRLANEVGSSGSPVFAKHGHRVIGILSAGAGNDMALTRPLRPILDAIATQSKTLADPSMKHAVQRLLSAAR